MSLDNSKLIIQNVIPSYASYKEVSNVKITEDNSGDVVLFDSKSINIDANEVVTLSQHEITLADSSKAGKTISQEFTMTWVKTENGKEIEFNGLTGSLKGQNGKPGVVFNSANGSVSVNLLLSRPEGSFAIFSKAGGAVYMIVAAPNANSQPDSNRIFVLPFTSGVKLPAGWWHSVPFPHPSADSIHLEEFVVENNENNAVNVAEEAGKPMEISEIKQ